MNEASPGDTQKENKWGSSSLFIKFLTSPWIRTINMSPKEAQTASHYIHNHRGHGRGQCYHRRGEMGCCQYHTQGRILHANLSERKYHVYESRHQSVNKLMTEDKKRRIN